MPDQTSSNNNTRNIIDSIMERAGTAPTEARTLGTGADTDTDRDNVLNRIMQANKHRTDLFDEAALAQMHEEMPRVVVKSLTTWLAHEGKYPDQKTMKTLVFLIGSWKEMGESERAHALAHGWGWLWGNIEEFLAANPDADSAMGNLVGKLERGEAE